MSIGRGSSAVITGAGSGLGRALALELGRRGARVLVSDVVEANMQATVDAIVAAGGEAHAQACDVRDAEAVQGLAERADTLFGGADVLVNNAGIAVVGEVGEVSLDDWRLQLDINLYGVIHGCHAFVPGMKARRRGYILNVASSAGLLSAAKMGPYNVSKAGVIALSETLATELDGLVKVSALCPTFFQSSLHTTARAPEALRAATEKMIGGARWTSEGIAQVALRGLERGQLYIIPQVDGQALWRAKRVLGAVFHGPLSARIQRRITGS